jgi:hypothetical protein
LNMILKVIYLWGSKKDRISSFDSNIQYNWMSWWIIKIFQVPKNKGFEVMFESPFPKVEFAY